MAFDEIFCIDSWWTRNTQVINESIEVVESVMLRGNLYRTVVAV